MNWFIRCGAIFIGTLLQGIYFVVFLPRSENTTQKREIFSDAYDVEKLDRDVTYTTS